jgi:hypothetical protein
VIVVPFVLGLLETGQLILRSGVAQEEMTLGRSLLLTMPRWLLLSPLALGVIEVCRRFPLGTVPVSRALGVHLAAGSLFCVLHLSACVVVYGFLLDGAPNQFPGRLRWLLTVYLAMDLLIYGSIVGASTAHRFAELSRRRELAASRLRASLVEARLDALQAQLHPHFLFNALNAAATLALRRDHDAVVAMLERLGRLLRAALDPKLPREVPLAHELALLEQFLEIQRVRFGDRLTIRVEVENGTDRLLVPPLLLQPLGENAVEHGIGGRPGPGTLRVAVRTVPEGVRLEVHDSGAGWPSREETGVGLANARARLDVLYGSSHRFERGLSVDGGALVAITLPIAGSRATSPASMPGGGRTS